MEKKIGEDLYSSAQRVEGIINQSAERKNIPLKKIYYENKKKNHRKLMTF